MKILLTGGAGFIGSNFTCAALKAGHTIINIDKLTYAGNLNNLGGNRFHENHHFYQIDICDGSAIQKVFLDHQPDFVLHMAAESHVDRSIDNPDDFIHTNINGTYTLLNAALKYFRGKPELRKTFKFIHLSTDEVFGALGPIGQFNETMPYRPNSPYAASKAASDLLVRSYYQTYDFPSIILNASNNYGPRQYPEKLIPVMLLSALKGMPLTVYGEGKQVRDWLYVEDHVAALFSIIESGIIGESYCVGADNEICNIDIVHSLCDMLDTLRPIERSYRELITFVSDRPGHDFRYATNASKLNAHTGWKPHTRLEEGLRQTVDWYVSQYDSAVFAEFENKRLGIKK